MTKKSKTARMGNEFSAELEEIKKERMARGIDKKERSTRVLTNLITKHELWVGIREDMYNEPLPNTYEI